MVSSYYVYEKDGDFIMSPYNSVDHAYWQVNTGVRYEVSVPRAEYLYFKERPEWAEQCTKLCWYEVVGYDSPEQEWHDHPDCPLHGSVPYLNLLDLVAAEEGIDSKDGIELGGG